MNAPWNRQSLPTLNRLFATPALCNSSRPLQHSGIHVQPAIYNEQGEQLQVIRAWNKRLSRLDTSNMQYAALQKIKDDAEQRQNTRVDFISKLTTDIVIATLILMFMNDSLFDSRIPCSCLHVSNTWRDYICQCPSGLRFKAVYQYWDEPEDIDTGPQLAKVARHTKSLSVHDVDEGGSWIADLLRGNDMCSLRYLYIEGELVVYRNLRGIWYILHFRVVHLLQ